MAPRKASTPPISLNVRILALADRHHHPYGFLTPKHAFTLKLLPETTIREACTHASEYLKVRFNKFVDGSRLEARDVNGYVFKGKEELGQELGDGGDLYLIEEALDVNAARKALLRDLDATEKGTRTPKAKKAKEPRKTPSQRSLEMTKQGRRMTGTELKKTPSGRPQTSRTVRSEPKRRTLSMAPLELEDPASSPAATTVKSSKPLQEQGLPDPLVESIEDSPPVTMSEEPPQSAKQLAKDVDTSERDCDATEARPPPATTVERRNLTTRPMKHDDASATMVQSNEDAPHGTKQAMRRPSTSQSATARYSDALVTAVASQRKLPRAISKAAGPSQAERVIPDSPDPPSPSINDTARDNPTASSWKPINAPKSSAEIQPRAATQPKAARAQSLVDVQNGIVQKKPDFLLGKPDPYDISAVLSDDEYYSPRQSKTIMSSSIRKLGSATKRAALTTVSVPRNSLLISKRSLVAEDRSKSPERIKPAATSQEEELTVLATPLARAPANTPAEAGPSSALGPLLSSPTNHVAAALARSRAQARRQPNPEYIVIEDSDVEMCQDVLGDTLDQASTSRRESKSLEASLPWSAPPLRMSGEDPFWTLRTTGRRTFKGRKSAVGEEVATEVMGNQALDDNQPFTVPTWSCNAPKRQILSTSAISSFDSGSLVKDPPKRAVQEAPNKSLVDWPVRPSSQAADHKPPLLLVHGSSSSEQGVEEIGYFDDGKSHNKVDLPVEAVETVVIEESSSPDVVEDEDEAIAFMTGPIMAEALFGDEEPIALPQVPPEDNGACLPVINELSALPPVPFEDHSHPKDEPFQLTRIPESDTKSDNVIVETPPSGQPFKRKRDLHDDLDSEEERRMQKKARREARAARKAERKRLVAEKLAQEEERKRTHDTWLQEERKRLAMEKAYRRARELEIVVSSPSKAAEMGLDFSDASDSHQESEYGSSPPNHTAVSPVFEGSDDSLESKESEETQSWRKLSKRHFSASPSSSLKDGVADEHEGSPSPITSEIINVEHTDVVLASHDVKAPQEVGDTAKINEPVRRKAVGDCSFLETVMGVSTYSPLQMHERIHMQMVLANLQGQHSYRAREDENTVVLKKVGDGTNTGEPVETRPKEVAKIQETIPHGPHKEAHTQDPAGDEDEDEDDITQHTVRSPAPSPKDLTAASGQASEVNGHDHQHKKDQKKNERRKGKDNKRKKRWRRKGQPSICKQLKRKHSLGAKGAEE
ncbi:hypothetical protein N0V82_006036 [Gnomoniopsis sp. IMI 355080]|nr:hypothetical protein N0V82_006036 [Gnomoniopsis sp. IMI 355080]